ncbi:MAG TPA: hypothetical protein VKU35_02050, partial [Candidatus Limnocylindria bacterium]|nr:hypothetical protein [Candidatus Limnocylindria bacterium]
MNPPSEQLVRDYLNRLSVAARGRLGYKDRQGLLERTRARIEVESGGLRDASAEQVRRALAALGEPIALVEKERGRIAATAATAVTAARRDAGIAGLFAGRKNGVIRQIWPADGDGAPAAVGPRASAAQAEAGFDLQVPGQLPVTGGTSVPTAVSISEVAGTPAGLEPSGVTVSGVVKVPVGSAVPAWPRESNGEPRRAGKPGQGGAAAAAGGPEADGSPRRNGISPGPPLPRRAPAEEGDAGAGTPASPPGPPAGRSSEPVVSAAPSPDAERGGGDDEGDEPASGVEFTISDAGPIEEYAEGG